MMSSSESLDIALSPTNISEIKVLLRPEAALIPFALKSIVNYYREKHVSDSLPLGSTKAILTRMAIPRQGDTASVDLSWSHAEHGLIGSAGDGQLKYNLWGGASGHQVEEVDSKVAERPKDSSSEELVNTARAVQCALEGANGHQSNSSPQYDAANGGLASELLQIGNCEAARSVSPVYLEVPKARSEEVGAAVAPARVEQTSREDLWASATAHDGKASAVSRRQHQSSISPPPGADHSNSLPEFELPLEASLNHTHPAASTIFPSIPQAKICHQTVSKPTLKAPRTPQSSHEDIRMMAKLSSMDVFWRNSVGRIRPTVAAQVSDANGIRLGKGVKPGKTSSEPPNPSISHKGGYACVHSGCELPPFETKYLLRCVRPVLHDYTYSI